MAMSDFGNDCCSNQLAKKQLEAEQKHQALENELNGYKTNLIKNSIRMCQTYMGDHAYNRGNLQVIEKLFEAALDVAGMLWRVLQARRV